MHLFKKYFSIVKKTNPGTYVFWVSLIFYISLYFNLNNKTLLGLFFIFLFVFWYKFKNFQVVLSILYFLFLPFDKGKSFSFILIPGWLMGTKESYKFWFNISFADLTFISLFVLILKEEIINRWRIEELKLNKSDIFLFCFLLFSFVSIFFSHYSLISFLAYLRLARLGAVYFLIQKIFKKQGFKKLMLLVLASLLIFQGGWAGLQFVFQRPLGKAIEPFGTSFSAYGHTAAEENTFFRAQGTWDHPNTLGSFAVIFLSFFLLQIMNPEEKKGKRKIFLVSFLFGFLGLIFSASRANWVVFGAMIFSITTFFKKRRIKLASLSKKWLGWILLLFLILGPFLILPRLTQIYFTLAEKGGVYYRTYLLQKAWFLSQEAPLGIGLATFPAILIKRFGFFTWPAPVHNLFLEILVEGGVFSLIFFLLFLVFAYKRFFLNLKALNHRNFFLKTGAFFASFAFLLSSQFYPFFLSSKVFEYFWLFLGIMLY